MEAQNGYFLGSRDQGIKVYVTFPKSFFQLQILNLIDLKVLETSNKFSPTRPFLSLFLPGFDTNLKIFQVEFNNILEIFSGALTKSELSIKHVLPDALPNAVANEQFLFP